MKNAALGDLRDWWEAIDRAMTVALPEAMEWVQEHAHELPRIDIAATYRAISDQSQRFALKRAHDLVARWLHRRPDGAGLETEDPLTGPRWQYVYWVAAEAAERVAAAPEVARWHGQMPGNRKDRKTFLSLLRVERAMVSAKPGETTTETMMRAGVSRRRGYELLAMKLPAKPGR